LKRDQFYFTHDADAKDDQKIILMIEDLGLEGYGIFWVLVESLRQAAEYRLPIKIIPAIARRYNTSTEKIKTLIEKYSLFEIDENLNFYSKSLIERMQLYDEKVEKRRLAANSRWECKSNANALQLQSKSNASKVKESKVKESKGNNKRKELKHFVDTSCEVRLSEKLFSLILQKNPNHKKPNIQSWARQIDLMIRVDKRQIEQIETIIDWCQADSFWQNNILSTKKLREKFDQLFMKMNNGTTKHQSKYDHNMDVAKRMINQAREEAENDEQRKRLQSPWDAFDCIPGQENE